VPHLQNPAPALGITLSPSQALIAQHSAKKQGLEKQIYFAEGDFTHVPLPNESLDIIYSVEAVCHAVHPEKYFKEAGRLLKKGGKLILVDDYQTNRKLTSHETKWLNAYIEGWHVPGVRSLEKTMEFAQENRLQLIKNEHLTPNLKLRNLPDPIAEFLLFAGGLLPIRHAILPSMVGSMALQQCLHMGIIEYHFLVFEK
jgi:cyclopropane fatty-acyl-phospholipid synthase-like methyltransferase